MHGQSVLKVAGLKGSVYDRGFAWDLKVGGLRVARIWGVRSKLRNVAQLQTIHVLKVRVRDVLRKAKSNINTKQFL